MEPNLLGENLTSTFKVHQKMHNNVEIKTCSEITIKEFLDFLKTAYQVQESLEGVLIANGMTEAIDWLKLKESQFVQKTETSIQTKDSDSVESCAKKSEKSASRSTSALETKLSEILAEGILDPVLPNLPSGAPCGVGVAAATLKKSATSKASEKSSAASSTSSSTTATASVSCASTKSKLNEGQAAKSIDKTSSQIEIHVCDESKNVRKDFVCDQRLLIEKMGYFADVTAGQRLADMDISVHCDVGIFEWLMRWVQQDALLEPDRPELDATNVTPILVSASFLKMEPLIDECLKFCHANLGDILKTNANVACLNDAIVKRLAAMYTNTELEAVKDKKDKLQSKLYAKMIASLVENADSESVRGHWDSLARVYRCAHCRQLVAPQVAHRVPCAPPRMRLQRDGSIASRHARDLAWDVNAHIEDLYRRLRTWRRVYWRLWGSAHFLFCAACRRYFAASQLGWCLYHPDAPQFFTLDAQKAPLPVGRYPCCGDRAYRFHLLANFRGCKFREHRACATTARDAAVLQLLLDNRALVVEEPPELMFPERLTRLVAKDTCVSDKLISKETFWWDGLEVIPERPKMGLLHTFSQRSKSATASDSQSNESSSDESDEESSNTEKSNSGSTSEEECKAPSNTGQPVVPVRRKKKRKNLECKLWQVHLSARSNQDTQRAYEEKTIKQISNVINKKIAGGQNCNATNRQKSGRYQVKNVNPLGGIWVRLEQEWREQNAIANKNRNTYSSKNKSRNPRF